MQSPETNSSKSFLVAYFGLLLAPFLLALDEIDFFLFWDVSHEHALVDKVVLFACVVWLVVGLAVFFLNRDRTRFSLRIQKPLISFYAMLLMFVLLEGFVRVALPPPTIPSLWPPATQWVSHPAAWGVAGVAETTRFTTNEIGLRGPSLPHGGKTYKIITVGGSTTECLVLDDSKEWPHLVMEGLNSRQKNLPVWLANAGVGGHTTVHHLMALRSVPVFKQVDMVILLFGINDLGATLVHNGGASQAQLEQDSEAFRQVMLSYGKPTADRPIYKRLRLYQYAQRVKTRLLGNAKRPSVGAPMAWLEMLRRRRAAGKLLPLPDLRVGLDEYRERVKRIVDQCGALQVRCLFLTQPVHWRAGLTPEEEASLWAGWIGPLTLEKPGLGYVSAAELGTAMNLYNQTLLEICREGGLECFDLASTIPKSATVFYDDDHYTEEGARVVADHLLDYLFKNPPFSKPGPAGAGAQEKQPN